MHLNIHHIALLAHYEKNKSKIQKKFAPALVPGRPVPLEILIQTFPSLWFVLTDNLAHSTFLFYSCQENSAYYYEIYHNHIAL